ncbi:hypothetical protein HK098_006355 [Nowakowskiella sp. JEL0407]|nr:hypothetical protein HK098_006355 [Nowakowskiella sp. JEL0407]
MANRTDSITLDENRLEYEVKQMLIVFGQKETEETWESHENAIFKLTAIMRGSGHLTNMISALKRLKQGIQNAISTDRTRLSRAAMLLVEEIGRSLGSRFEALVDSFVPPVLKIATRANRVFVASSTQCLMVLVEHTGCTSIIPFLVESVKNPSKTLRIAAMDTLLKFMNTQSSDRYDNLVDLVEAAIRIGIVDSTPVVRETCRKIFEIYKEIFPYRVDGFVSPLNDITKKYLKITTRENSQPQRNGISSRPKTSKKPDAIDFPSAHNESTTHNLSRAKSQRSLREEYRKPRNPREVDMSFGSHDSYSQRDTSRTAQRPPQYDEASGISSNSGWLSSGKATQKAMRVPNSNPAPLSQNEVAAELFGALAKLSNPIRSGI